jgi:DNA-binding NarL/FixJ family response regulator
MPVDTKRFTVLLIEDHPLFAQGITALLENERDVKVCAVADEPRLAFSLVLQHKPDLVIMDLTLKQNADGFDLIKSIAAQELPTRMLVISAADEQLYARRCLQAGASGFVAKIEPPDVILCAVRTVLDGKIYLSASLRSAFLSQLVQGADRGTGHDNLTDREFQLLTLYGQGLNTAGVAERLGLSEKTVDCHRTTLKKKLGIATMADLLQYAISLRQRSGR